MFLYLQNIYSFCSEKRDIYFFKRKEPQRHDDVDTELMKMVQLECLYISLRVYITYIYAKCFEDTVYRIFIA